MANQILLKRASGSDPTASDLSLGEIAIRTDNGKLFTKKDNGTVAEISGAGGGNNFSINTLSSSSSSGGGSASFNGTATRFTLSNPPNIAAQLLVSINGVIQKPNTGTSPSEGFAVDGNDIIFSSAPASGADFFILTYASLAIAEPSDNTVTSAKIVDGAIVNADINASAAIAGTKISPNFGSQDITGSKLTINSTTPTIEFPESDGNPDYRLLADGGVFVLQDQTNSANRFTVTTSVMAVNVNLDCHAGLDVTGNITGTGDLTIDTNTLHVDSSSNRVGIGTISPNEKLEVSGDIQVTSGSIKVTGATPGVRFTDTAATGGFGHIGVNNTSGSLVLRSDDGNALSGTFMGFEVDSSERMRIDSSGRVGIGTTSPSKVLHCKTETSKTNEVEHIIQLTHTSSGTTTTGFGTGIRFQGERNNGALQTIGDINFEADVNSGTNISAALVFKPALQGTVTERMRIASDGLVSIGDSSNGSGASSATVGEGELVVGSQTGGLITACDLGSGERLRIRGGGGATSLGSTSNHPLIFHTNGSANERMRIDTSGRVGIGTSSPGSYNSNFDNFVIRGSGNTGMTISTDDNSFGQIAFSNAEDAHVSGAIQYRNSDNILELRAGESNGAVIFSTVSNTERMRIDSSGRVLVGTSTQFGDGNDKLMIENGTTGGRLTFGTSASFAEPIIGQMSAYWADNKKVAAISFFGGSDTSNKDDGTIRFATSSANNLTERMRINTSGNIGIGTTSPTLLKGDGGRLLHLAGSNNPEIVLERTTSGTEAKASIRITDTKDLRFAVKDGSASTIDALSIDSFSGNVGIGTTSPSSELHVSALGASDEPTIKISSENSNIFLRTAGSSGSFPTGGGGNDGELTYIGGNFRVGTGTASKNLIFFNGSGYTERMRINSSGQISIGDDATPMAAAAIHSNYLQALTGQSMVGIVSNQTSHPANTNNIPAQARSIVGAVTRQCYIGTRRVGTNNPAGFLYIQQRDGGNTHIWADNNAKIRTSNDAGQIGSTSGTVVGSQTSDIRLKNNLGSVSYGLTEINKIIPIKYTFKKDESSRQQLGFSAQDIQSIIPESVYDTKETDEVESEEVKNILAMDYVALIPVLVNAVKELSTKVQALEAK